MAVEVETLSTQVLCKNLDSVAGNGFGVYTRGYLQLLSEPLNGTAAVDPIGGPAQVQGKDFVIVGSRLYFKVVSGVPETGVLSASDIIGVADRYPDYHVVLRVVYNKS